MKKIDCEAIVLKCSAYREKQMLCTLFTKEQGLISAICKQGSLTALTHIECLLTPSRSLYRVNECKLLSSFDALRTRFDLLSTAGEMAREILLTQLPEKKAPPLFALLRVYLEQLPLFPDPQILAWSFRLKRLRYDGGLHLVDLCARCGSNPARLIYEGESLCPLCGPRGSVPLDIEGWQGLKILTYATSIEMLKCVERKGGMEEICNAKGGT